MHIPRNIVIATDLSEASMQAVETGAALVNALGAQVTLVCAFDPMQSMPMIDGSMMANEVWVEELDAIEDRVERALEKLRDEKLAGTGCDIVVRRDGSPGRAVVDVAKELNADLVVVGSHGRTGIKRFLLGSVAEKIVRLCECSVFVARA